MNDQEKFLAAIAEALDDPAPRLLYADWLEEHGDDQRAAYWRNFDPQTILTRIVQPEQESSQWSEGYGSGPTSYPDGDGDGNGIGFGIDGGGYGCGRWDGYGNNTGDGWGSGRNGNSTGDGHGHGMIGNSGGDGYGNSLSGRNVVIGNSFRNLPRNSGKFSDFQGNSRTSPELSGP